MGKSPKEASIDGASEMFPAVLTATLTTIFAFLPLLIMSGKMGVFMSVLPVMISILLLSSLFEAFYFLPLHAKEFFSIGKISQKTEKKSGFWETLNSIYRAILSFLLRFKWISLFLLVGLIGYGTVQVKKSLKFQLFPEFDAQNVYVNGKVNINYKLEETEEFVTKIEKILLEKLDRKSVASVTAIVGYKMNADQSAEVGENLFQIFINLHEKAPENFFDKYINPIFSLEYDDSDMVREKKARDIIVEVQNALKDIKNLEVKGERVFDEINIFVQQTGIVKHDIEIGLTSPSMEKIKSSLKLLKDRLKEIRGVEDIGDNADEGEKELKLRVNEYGQSLGLNEGYITSILRGAFLKRGVC